MRLWNDTETKKQGKKEAGKGYVKSQSQKKSY
jgi:hypothetical protein